MYFDLSRPSTVPYINQSGGDPENGRRDRTDRPISKHNLQLSVGFNHLLTPYVSQYSTCRPTRRFIGTKVPLTVTIIRDDWFGISYIFLKYRDSTGNSVVSLSHRYGDRRLRCRLGSVLPVRHVASASSPVLAGILLAYIGRPSIAWSMTRICISNIFHTSRPSTPEVGSALCKGALCLWLWEISSLSIIMWLIKLIH